MAGGHDALRMSLGTLALGMLETDERWAVLQHLDEYSECNAQLDFLELAALLRPAANSSRIPHQHEHGSDSLI